MGLMESPTSGRAQRTDESLHFWELEMGPVWKTMQCYHLSRCQRIVPHPMTSLYAPELQKHYKTALKSSV